MTDTVNDEHVTPEEKYRALVSAAADTVDVLISSGLSDQTLKSTTFNTVAGTTEYDLSTTTYVPDGDFYKVSKVYVNEGSDQFRPIDRINLGDVQSFRPPQAVIPVKILYIPMATDFQNSNGDWDEDATFDGINGWEEHTLCKAAAWIMRKKQDDFRPFEEEANRLEQRMAFLGNTDFSGPARVVRRRGRGMSYFPYQQGLSAWALRGKKICLYYAYPWVP